MAKIAKTDIVSTVNKLSEELKKYILQTENKVEFSGKAYYFSENGDDSNDGLSSDTPMKSLDKINDIEFSEGDAVLLERGSLFRGGIELNKDKMVLSSYGSGEKPKIYGSLRNYNSICDWKKTDVADVYCCSDTFDSDVGNIVFNNGEAYALKQLIGNFGFEGNIEELKDDLMMYHCEQDQKLYLCSKFGNPAERFESIEICILGSKISIKADGVTVDNICFKYFGGHAVCGAERKDITVSNCEFGWIGGSVQFFNEEANAYVRFGNAIEIYADVENFTACYNYIYQVYDAGITHQFFHDVKRKMDMINCNYHHNLIEYCSYSIEYALQHQSTEEDYAMKDINISDNIMRYSGFGFGNQRPDYANPAHIKSWELENRAVNFQIKNNIFQGGKYRLVHIASAEKQWLPKCSGNTYIQNHGGDLGRCGLLPARTYRYSEMEEFLKFEKNSTCYIV